MNISVSKSRVAGGSPPFQCLRNIVTSHLSSFFFKKEKKEKKSNINGKIMVNKKQNRLNRIMHIK